MWIASRYPLDLSMFIKFDVKWLVGRSSGRAVKGVSVRLLACWHSGFEYRRGLDVCLL